LNGDGRIEMGFSRPRLLMQVEERADEPFPLRQRYRSRVLPIFALFVVSAVTLTALAVRSTVENLHLESAAARVREIAAELNEKEPAMWGALVAGRPTDAQEARLGAALREAAQERGIDRMKVYGVNARTLFSTVASEIGTTEANDALRDSIRDVRRVLVRHREPDGGDYHELYVPLAGDGDRTVLVFELYEPAGHLTGILMRALPLPTLVPGLLLVGMLVVLGLLIRRAQAGIDLRAQRVRELGRRLESLVSTTAAGAVRAATGGELPVQRSELTLLYADVRSFTDFAEHAPPEEVAAFLNRAMTLQIDCIARQGGDVDKLIGDALLARFDGAAKERRAIEAGVAILAAVEAAALPRGVGIGVFTGPVISEPIGPISRRDYTVIGDSVNTCARLCGVARRGEVVVDTETLRRSGLERGFGPVEAVQVKGRQQRIAVRRATAPPQADPASDGTHRAQVEHANEASLKLDI
jgi:adenylate cyclase